MELFKPTIYKKNIYEIPYLKLKEEGIKCLVFDLDNTLGLVSNKTCPIETKKLMKDLKEDFLVVISSNNNQKRIQIYLDELEIDGISWSMKPTTRGLSIIKRKYHLKKEEMCMIGDQLLTDILAGKLFSIKTILVDPLGKKDLKITGLNRKIENRIIKNYEKKGIFKRGNYYE